MNKENNHQGILRSLETFKWTIAEIPKFRFLGDDVLKEICVPFREEEFGGKEMERMAEEMINTLKKYKAKTGMGVGLSANQIGFTRRMSVIWLGEKPKVFVNPEALKLEGKGSYWECCMSSGTVLIGKVIRPWEGTFRYKDLEGKEYTLKANPKQTRVFLHEIGHLDGITCVEKYEPGTMRFTWGSEDVRSAGQLEKIE